MSRILSFLFVFIILINMPVLAQSMGDSLVTEVEELYLDGKFKEAELVGLRALLAVDDFTEDQRIDLYKTLGFIYVALSDTVKAKQQFINWLKIDTGAHLDPFYISPKIIRIFDLTKTEFLTKRQKKIPADYGELNMQIEAVKRSALFPGLGQTFRGQKIKGYTLTIAEAALLGTFVYTQVSYQRAKDDYLDETDASLMQNRYDEYNLFYTARNISLSLAIGVYLYSLVDALYFPPRDQSNNIEFSIGSSNNLPYQLTLTFSLP